MVEGMQELGHQIFARTLVSTMAPAAPAAPAATTTTMAESAVLATGSDDSGDRIEERDIDKDSRNTDEEPANSDLLSLDKCRL
jgi:hypothetical protein